jgi:hypothetical protein
MSKQVYGVWKGNTMSAESYEDTSWEDAKPWEKGVAYSAIAVLVYMIIVFLINNRLPYG